MILRLVVACAIVGALVFYSLRRPYRVRCVCRTCGADRVALSADECAAFIDAHRHAGDGGQNLSLRPEP